MMERAGFTPDKHVEHLARVQKKEGADAVKLGAVSGQQYKDIFRSRAFDEYFFQIPPKKRWEHMHRSCTLVQYRNHAKVEVTVLSPKIPH